MMKMSSLALIHVSVQYGDIIPLVITAAVGLAYFINFMKWAQNQIKSIMQLKSPTHQNPSQHQGI